MLPILAVHISNSVLAWPWQVGGFALLAAALAVAMIRVPQDLIPRLGVLTALFFVASQQHLPLGPASVHLLLNGLLGIILGWRCVIAIAVGLSLQAFLLGHGGITTIGVNFAILAIPALLASFIFRWLPKRRIGFTAFMLGIAAAVITVVLHASVLYLGAKGDWAIIAKTSLLMHIPIIITEGFIVAFAVTVVSKARPEWLGITLPGTPPQTALPTDPSQR